MDTVTVKKPFIYYDNGITPVEHKPGEKVSGAIAIYAIKNGFTDKRKKK